MHTTEVGHASAGSENEREKLNVKKNLPEDLRRGNPQYAHSETDVAQFAKTSRQAIRAAGRRKHFRSMEGTQSHIVLNPKTGRLIETIPLRAERRRLSRAYAAGDWKKRKVVA